MNCWKALSSLPKVTLMAFLAFVLPIENADGSLALTSACFLAVFAQRYIISDDLPRPYPKP